MPDVEITNPKVQIELFQGESTTVPDSERWKVSILHVPDNGSCQLNGNTIINGNDTNTTGHIRTDLFGGDTISTFRGRARIRGYRVGP